MLPKSAGLNQHMVYMKKHIGAIVRSLRVDLGSSWCLGYELTRIKAKLGLRGEKWDAHCIEVVGKTSRQARDYMVLAKAYSSAEEMIEKVGETVSFATAVVTARALVNPDSTPAPTPEPTPAKAGEGTQSGSKSVTIPPAGGDIDDGPSASASPPNPSASPSPAPPSARKSSTRSSSSGARPPSPASNAVRLRRRVGIAHPPRGSYGRQRVVGRAHPTMLPDESSKLMESLKLFEAAS